MSRHRQITVQLAALVAAAALVCIPTAAAATGPAVSAQAVGTEVVRADKSTALASVRRSLTKEVVAGWRKDPLFVDDIVGAAATRSQIRAIHRAIDDAQADHVYVALLPEIGEDTDDPLLLSDTRPVMAGVAGDAVASLHRESAVVILATATHYGRWEPNSYWVDADGVSASATSHFPQGVDTGHPASVVSYGIRSVGNAQAGEDPPKPNDAEAPPFLANSNFDYWMDPDGPNLITLILTGLALAGAVMLIRLRARAGRGLTPTELSAKQQRSVRKAEADIRRIADDVIESEPTGQAQLDARDAIMTIDKAASVLTSGRFPDDARKDAALLVLADDARLAHRAVTGRSDTTKPGGPHRHEHCFFNPLHGRAAAEARWRGESRQWLDVPACKTCSADLKRRRRPASLAVRVGRRVKPYWALDDVFYARSGFGAFENLAETIVQVDAEARATT
ncbi:hypothetical protein [Spelaeicoccus albus]|uniref:Uncharacterized protein n=1 Tax=Spelaeicoccus albus TaxID=1280376 RepID=A0A7Z0D5R4_9MICO|nr:hypothetical protein [Spelaeicoccus albus]NYI69339.1 hypothetical protein [Spelaeicoccus albus]